MSIANRLSLYFLAALGLVANRPMSLGELTKALIEGEFLEDFEGADEELVEDIVGDLLTETNDIWVSVGKDGPLAPYHKQ